MYIYIYIYSMFWSLRDFGALACSRRPARRKHRQLPHRTHMPAPKPLRSHWALETPAPKPLRSPWALEKPAPKPL